MSRTLGAYRSTRLRRGIDSRNLEWTRGCYQLGKRCSFLAETHSCHKRRRILGIAKSISRSNEACNYSSSSSHRNLGMSYSCTPCKGFPLCNPGMCSYKAGILDRSSRRIPSRNRSCSLPFKTFVSLLHCCSNSCMSCSYSCTPSIGNRIAGRRMCSAHQMCGTCICTDSESNTDCPGRNNPNIELYLDQYIASKCNGRKNIMLARLRNTLGCKDKSTN
jgi:hypothetical protein